MGIRRIVGGAGILCAAGSAFGGTVNLFQDAGNTYQAPALTGFQTHGDDMVGMRVTAYFTGGLSQTVVWGALGPSNGGAFGSNWGLTETTDTFGSAWTLTNQSGVAMTGLVLNGSPGNTLFDRTFSGFGTNGSANGWDYTESSGPAALVTNVTYRNQFQLTGFTPVGDLFETLELQFTNPGGLADASVLKFIQDTDNGAGGPVILIPLPPAAWAAMPALLGLGVVRRLRRR